VERAWWGQAEEEVTRKYKMRESGDSMVATDCSG